MDETNEERGTCVVIRLGIYKAQVFRSHQNTNGAIVD